MQKMLSSRILLLESVQWLLLESVTLGGVTTVGHGHAHRDLRGVSEGWGVRLSDRHRAASDSRSRACPSPYAATGGARTGTQMVCCPASVRQSVSQSGSSRGAWRRPRSARDTGFALCCAACHIRCGKDEDTAVESMCPSLRLYEPQGARRFKAVSPFYMVEHNTFCRVLYLL